MRLTPWEEERLLIFSAAAWAPLGEGNATVERAEPTPSRSTIYP